MEHKQVSRYWQHGDPFSMVAVCNREQAEQLLKFDHYQVVVNNCWGILITYHWMTIENPTEPLIAIVHFNPAPKHTQSDDQIRLMIRKHPIASPNIQAIVDQLVFRLPEY